MRFLTSVAVCCCAALAACTAPPGPEYRFTASQLAWQPYQAGQVLRFGNSQTATVRTYRVTRVIDVMTKLGGRWNVKSPPSYQAVTAFLQRTDSVGVEFEALGLVFDFDSPSVVSGNEPAVYAYLNWDALPNMPAAAALPVDELNQGLPLDTTRYGSVRLLPTYTLGAATYNSVVRYALQRTRYSNLTSPTTGLYLTKANGVVGFVQRNTLWYRIP